MRRLRFGRIVVFLLILLLPAVYFTRDSILTAAGSYLVRAEQPAKADLIVVMAGDGYGHRVLKGGELATQGFAPLVLVSGPPGFYGVHEADLAIPFAVRRGYPESLFVPFAHDAHSTAEEARILLAEFNRRQVKSVLIVTSTYHTRRTGKIFRALAPPGLEIHVVGSRDEYFTPDAWWRNREGRKTFLYEWLKTISMWAPA